MSEAKAEAPDQVLLTQFTNLSTNQLSPIEFFNNVTAHHQYSDTITVTEFNPSTMTKPIEVNGIIHSYLINNFFTYSWDSIEPFDPINFDQDQFIADYDVSIQNFHHFLPALLYSYTPSNTFSQTLDYFTDDLTIRSKFSPLIHTPLSKLPYPIEQSSLCTHPIIQQSLLQFPSSLSQLLLEDKERLDQLEQLEQFKQSEQCEELEKHHIVQGSQGKAQLSSIQFHFLILSLYSNFHTKLLQTIQLTQDEIERLQPSENEAKSSPHQPLGSDLLNPQQSLSISTQFPLLSLTHVLQFTNFIRMLFSSSLLPFESISPLTITLLLDIYSLLLYYSLYFRWTTYKPTFMDSGFDMIIKAPQHKPTEPPNQPKPKPLPLPEFFIDPQQLSTFSTYDEFIDQHYIFPTINEFLLCFIPETHFLKVANIYFHHTAFYTVVESEFISRTYKVTLPHAAWAIDEAPPFRTLTQIGFELSDLDLLAPAEDDFYLELDSTKRAKSKYIKTKGSDALPKPLLTCLFPDAPQLKTLPKYATIIQQYIEPVLFPPTLMNKTKIILQKFCWRFKITNYSEIASILSFPMPQNHRQLAVGYIASMLYENRRFQDLSTLLTQFNIAPTNAIYTIFHHTMFPDFEKITSPSSLLPTEHFDSFQGINEVTRYFSFAKSYARSNLQNDFLYFNQLLSTYTPSLHDVTISDDKLPYLIQLWFWIKYHNSSSRGFSPFLLQPVSIHYHHYYQYTLGRKMFMPLVLLGHKVYIAVLGTVQVNLVTSNANRPPSPTYQSFAQYIPTCRCFFNQLTEKMVLHAQSEGLQRVTEFVASNIQTVGVLDFRLLNRMNPHIIESVITGLISVQLSLAFTPSYPNFQHLKDYYSTTPFDFSPTNSSLIKCQPINELQSRLLLGSINNIVSKFQKDAQRIISPSVSSTRSWFQHFSRVVKILRNNSVDLKKAPNSDELIDQRVGVNNRHMISLFDNFIFFAYTSAVVEMNKPFVQQHQFIPSIENPMQYSALPIPAFPESSFTGDASNLIPIASPIPTLLRYDHFLSTFQLLFSDVSNIFSTNILWYAEQLFTNFFSTQPELEVYLKANKNESEFFTLHPSFHFTPSPSPTPTTMDSNLESTNITTSTSALSSISASTKINKFISGLLPYSVDLLYLCNQFNPFSKLLIFQQFCQYFKRGLFFGHTEDFSILQLRFKLAQSTGSLPAFKNYLSIPWFLPDADSPCHAADLIFSKLPPKYVTSQGQVSLAVIPSAPKYIFETQIDPIREITLHKYGFTFNHLSFLTYAEDFTSLYQFWCLLYSSGYLHSLNLNLPEFPLHYFPQLITSLHSKLRANVKANEHISTLSSTGQIKKHSYPLHYTFKSVQPSEETIIENDAQLSQRTLLQQYTYRLTTPTTFQKNPTLALYNLVMIQSVFLPPTLPYFAPSLFTGLVRIALHGLERLMHLWNYHGKILPFQGTQNNPKSVSVSVSSTPSPYTLPQSTWTTFTQSITALDDIKQQLTDYVEVDTPPPKPNKYIKQTPEPVSKATLEEQLQISTGKIFHSFNYFIDSFISYRLGQNDIDAYLDIESQCNVPYSNVAPLEPYEYAAIWLLFGANVLPYHVSHDSYLSMWELVRTSPVETTTHQDGSTTSVYSAMRKFVQVNSYGYNDDNDDNDDTRPGLALNYNIIFLSELLLTMVANPVLFCNHIRTLLFQFSDIASYWEFLETPGKQMCNFLLHFEALSKLTANSISIASQNMDSIPAGMVLAAEHVDAISTLSNSVLNGSIEQCHQALEILDFDLPAFSTPWEHQSLLPPRAEDSPSDPSSSTSPLATSVLPLSTTATLLSSAPSSSITTPLSIPISTPSSTSSSTSNYQPHRQGLLYFLYDSILPHSRLVDETLFIMSKFDDTQRVFSPPTNHPHRSWIEYFAPQSSPDDDELNAQNSEPNTDIASKNNSSQRISISIVDGTFLRAIQRQTPVLHLLHLLPSLTPHLLDHIIIISHALPSVPIPKDIYEPLTTETAEPLSLCHVMTTFELNCTIRDYIHHCHPDASDILLKMNEFDLNHL